VDSDGTRPVRSSDSRRKNSESLAAGAGSTLPFHLAESSSSTRADNLVASSAGRDDTTASNTSVGRAKRIACLGGRIRVEGTLRVPFRFGDGTRSVPSTLVSLRHTFGGGLGFAGEAGVGCPFRHGVEHLLRLRCGGEFEHFHRPQFAELTTLKFPRAGLL